MTESIVFGTVVYSSVIPFLDDFFSCLALQTYKNFKLLIINEDVPKEILNKKLAKFIFDYYLIDTPATESVIGHRIRLIKTAYELGADLIIFGDADDCFSNNRVEKICLEYVHEKEAFYYNEIRYMGYNKKICSIPNAIKDISVIMQSNFLGMSNTAVNLKMLNTMFIDSLWECNTPIFDWYFYSRLLLNIGCGKYCDGAITYYRIHDENIAGKMQKNEDNIAKELNIKRSHYQLMQRYSKEYKQLLLNFDQFQCETGLIKNCYWWGLTKIEM